MSGIRYLVDERGQKAAVVINLKEHGDLWEDFHDALVAQSRRNEPRETIESVKRRFKPKHQRHG